MIVFRLQMPWSFSVAETSDMNRTEFIHTETATDEILETP
jgi:hypothetical protein